MIMLDYDAFFMIQKSCVHVILESEEQFGKKEVSVVQYYKS